MRQATPEAESSLRIIHSCLQLEGGARTGGYLCVARCRDGRVSFLIHDPIGVTPPGKEAECRALALDGIERLLANPAHQLSWQSGNPDANRLEGAVRAVNSPIILAGFAGLPGLANEALILHWMVMLDLLTWEQANAYARISSNDHFLRIPRRAFLTKAPAD